MKFVRFRWAMVQCERTVFIVHIHSKSGANIQKNLNFVCILYMCHFFFVTLQPILGESVP